MRGKLTVAIMVSLVLAAVFSLNPVGLCFEKQTATRMSVDQRAGPFSPQEKEPTFCAIVNDDGVAAWVGVGLEYDLSLAVYMDPGTCAGEPAYPFRVTDVHFDLIPFLHHGAWPVNLQFSIKEVPQDGKCAGPDPVAAIWSESFSFPEDSSYYNLDGPINFSLSQPFCVYEPFFLEIMYLDYIVGPDSFPSLSMDEAIVSEDTCNNWGKAGGIYKEWSEFWDPIPGDPIIRATGYTDAPECEDLWYWKPDKPAGDPPAPSGMPDFDQNQDPWVGYCGPVAVANCLWWFGAVPPGWGPPQLVDTLARYFHTNPAWGTHIDTMQMGLDQYLIDYGFALQESTFEMPSFFEMEDSLKKCQDIILLLGFWWSSDGNPPWYREGGHYVTMAGVCSESLKIAVSDPNRDAAETGGVGRVRPPHPPHPGDPLLHNDPMYVSHDMYNSILDPPFFPPETNPFWQIDYEWQAGEFSGMNVPEKFKAFSRPAPTDGKQIYVTEVEYAVMICPTPSAVEDGEEDATAPRNFELEQNYPNPFNNETVIKFSLQKPAEVSLAIYNILGQKVRTLLERRLGAGLQSVMWDGKDEKGGDISSGIYFYQLMVGDLKETKRLVLLK